MRVLASRTFLSFDAEEWSAIGVWFTGLITVGLLIYAARQLRHSRLASDEQSRPYVVVDLGFRSVFVYILVTNIGQRPARNVQVFLDAPVESAAARVTWQGSGIFARPMELFAPGRRLEFALDIMTRRLAGGQSMQISGRVEYSGSESRHRPGRNRQGGQSNPDYVEKFTLDLSVFEQTIVGRRDLSDLADDVHEIRRTIAQASPQSTTA